MIRFRHAPTKSVIGVNLKVMYTFFSFHPDFECEGEDGDSCGQIDFFIVRNPYDRIVSCFFDKCRIHCAASSLAQCVQEAIMREMKTATQDSLLELSFIGFCRIVPQLIYTDRHFFPQTHQVDWSRVKNITKMETQLGDLSQVLGVDFSRKENATKHGAFSDYFDAPSRKIISDVYADDFRLLGYET